MITYQHYIIIIGKLEAEASNYLEKRVSELPTMDEANTIENTILAMQYILSTDFKSSEIEIGVISINGKFRVLSEEEIEERLTAITLKADN